MSCQSNLVCRCLLQLILDEPFLSSKKEAGGREAHLCEDLVGTAFLNRQEQSGSLKKAVTLKKTDGLVWD